MGGVVASAVLLSVIVLIVVTGVFLSQYEEAIRDGDADRTSGDWANDQYSYPTRWVYLWARSKDRRIWETAGARRWERREARRQRRAQRDE